MASTPDINTCLWSIQARTVWLGTLLTFVLKVSIIWTQCLDIWMLFLFSSGRSYKVISAGFLRPAGYYRTKTFKIFKDRISSSRPTQGKTKIPPIIISSSPHETGLNLNCYLLIAVFLWHKSSSRFKLRTQTYLTFTNELETLFFP